MIWEKNVEIMQKYFVFKLKILFQEKYVHAFKNMFKFMNMFILF